MIVSSLIYAVGLVVMWASYVAEVSVFSSFLMLYVVTVAFNMPKRAFSPLSIFYAYYGTWFIIAPLFAERYQGTLDRSEYVLAIAMAYTVFGLGVISIQMGEYLASKFRVQKVYSTEMTIEYLMRWIWLLYVFSSAMIGLIIFSSGGLEKWIADPGDAFLNRGGSGVYVILSHFSSIALAALSGYCSFKTRKKYPIVLFLIWLVLTSPVHGSKLQISLLAMILFLPWLSELKLMTRKSLFLYFSLLLIFFLGLYFRNFTWIDTGTMLPYALNYFTALENLALSLRDFEPGFVTTFFLPFVKFLTPFGLSEPTMYYDMNHMLTDHYYPAVWEIRATEQWPVETDLYLNFFFFGGLPLVAAYLLLVGAFYGYARKRNSLGSWVAAFLMIIFMVSHLRGSLINHTDFYIYPYILLMFFVLRKLPLISDK